MDIESSLSPQVTAESVTPSSHDDSFALDLKDLAISGDEGVGSDPNGTESAIKKDMDTVSELMAETICTKTRIMLFCVQSLCYFHCGAQSGVYLVIPYYVASTPEHGWTVSDLSIIFGVFNIGGIVAAQICMIAGSSMKNRDRILLIGHCSQFIAGIIGFVIMSSVFGFNMVMFFVGSFLGGFSTDCTTIESYGALISDREEVQSSLLGSIGKVFLVAGILNSFLLPAIYEQLGFSSFCAALCVLELLALCTLALLWYLSVRSFCKPIDCECRYIQVFDQRTRIR